MTNKILLLITLATASACSVFTKSPQKPAPTIYSFANNITEESLYNDLVVISHDSLEGRETGTIGEQKAARYISKRYTEMGLKPVGDNNSYFQHFELIQPAVQKISYRVLNASDNSVVDASTHSADETGNFITIYGGSDPLSGPIAFVGTGMKDEEAGINQLPEDVDGKWLLVLYQRGKTNMRLLQGAFAQGALGVILINDTDVDDFMEEAESRQSNFGQGRGLSLKYLQKKDAGASPAYNRINPELAAKLLGLSNLEGLAKLEEQLSENPAAFQAKDLDFILEHTPTVDENTVTSQNIVAFLEGSDPELKHEVVVLSSHYDHVGITRPDSTGDALNNGADDDGSGTVATIQTAQAMSEAKAAGVGPKRSVLFLNVSGEEKGLLGSRYYSDHPIFSIENTVADINIDMIGRVDPEHQGKDSSYVYIIGGEIISSHLDSLTVLANDMGPNLDLSKRYNDLNDPNQFYRRSDHWNFGRLGVPFVFFFNGVHADYHRPSDEIDKITFGPYLQRTRLVYNLTAILANSADRPVVDNQEFIEKTQVHPR
jgi:hypothetical protein